MSEPKVYGVEDVSDADAEALRASFMERVQKDDLKDDVDPADMRRLRTDPLWLKRFIAHGDLDQKSALKFMVDTFKFRKQMSVNTMRLEDVDRSLMERGVMCTHGADRAGTRMIVFNARLHEKGHMEECKTYLTFWLEKVEREERGRRVAIFFDMADARLSNVDIPFISYLINLFKYYYPDMLSAIIVYEMHWIMNAAWNVVKALLPAKTHQLIHFTKKKDVGELVGAESRLVRWGGQDQWQYKFDPREHAMPPSPFLGDVVNGDSLQEESIPNGHVDEASTPNGHISTGSGRKSSLVDRHKASNKMRDRTDAAKHHQAAKYHSIVEEGDQTSHGGAAKVHFSVESSASLASIAEAASDGAPAEAEMTADLDGMLEITPGQEVWFGSGSNGGRLSTIQLVNIRSGPVAFKVKTTSPEKFRVKPSTGVVGTGKRVAVILELNEGVSPQHVITDRFLLVAAPVPHERVPQKDMATLWRSVASDDKHEHRLRCAAAPAAGNEPLAAMVRTIASRLDAVGAKVDEQHKKVERAVEGQQAARSRLTVALLVMAVMIVVDLYLSYQGRQSCS